MSRSEHLIIFDLEYQDNISKRIPATVLSKTLSAAQRIVNMIANEIENQPDSERDRLSQDRSDKYLLYIEELRVGSAHSALSVGNSHTDALAPDDLDQVALRFMNLTKAIQQQDHVSLFSVFDSKNRRIKALKAYKEIIPDYRTGIGLTIGVDSNSMVLDSYRAAQNIDFFIQKEFEHEDTVIAIGKLNRLLFDKNEFHFHYAPTGKSIKVKYTDDLEGFLLKHPRDFVQISGKAVLNNNMNVTKISEVYMVDDVDLSPVQIESFKYDGESFRVKKPITLQVTLDDSEQLYCVSAEEIALNIASDTREGLVEDIHEKLAFLWHFYIESKIEPCRQDVIELRSSLLEFMEKSNG